MRQRRGSSRCFFLSFLLVDSRIKQARLETISCRQLSSHSPFLKAVNTRSDLKAGNAQQQRVDSLGSTALWRSPFSLPHAILEARWDPPMELWITLHGRDTESEAWRTRIVSAKAKGVLQQRADLKDWSRLKLIEILFVAFGVFYVSLLFSPSLPPSLAHCPQSEQRLSLNKQIRLHLWRQASQICMAIISSSGVL